MTDSYMWHDSFIYETWLKHMWDMTHSRHTSFICKTWPVYIWDMTRSNVKHDSFKCETWLVRSYVRDAGTRDTGVTKKPNIINKTKHNPCVQKTYTQDIHETHAEWLSHILSWVAAAGRADRAARRTLVQAHAHTQAHTHTYTHKQIQTHTQAHTHTHT